MIDAHGNCTPPSCFGYDQIATFFVADTGACATASNSSLVIVSFSDLRTSPDWQCQISQSQPGCDPLESTTNGVPNGQGWQAFHFQGFADGNATKAMLMGMMSNGLHDHGARFNDGHPTELSVPTSPSPGGAKDERLGVKVHISAACDVWARFDIVLTAHCDGTGQVVQTDFTLEPGNPAGDFEGFNWCTVGKAFFDILTLGLDHAWLEGVISDAFADKISHAMSKQELGRPPANFHFGFNPQPGGGGGCGGICESQPATRLSPNPTSTAQTPRLDNGVIDCATLRPRLRLIALQ